jgi:hypothetical protein
VEVAVVAEDQPGDYLEAAAAADQIISPEDKQQD